MRKRTKGKKFNRKRDQRKAFFKALLRGLALHGKIKTTESRAKEIRPLMEKFITIANKKDGNDLAKRRMLARSFSPELVKKIMAEIAPKYKEGNGGYTRITKLGQRTSDGARMAIIELIN
ncbi:50S ribosomal protein L17 [Candidatus Parcubacteria bacterium]|nr:50S ribosomal protein L17 [Candidatus Parcubacteria bacterium]